MDATEHVALAYLSGSHYWKNNLGRWSDNFILFFLPFETVSFNIKRDLGSNKSFATAEYGSLWQNAFQSLQWLASELDRR